MSGLIDRLQLFFEKRAFGVCTALGEKMGIATSSYPFIFHLCLFFDFWVSHNHLFVTGIYIEYALPFEETQYNLGFLKSLRSQKFFSSR